MIRQRLSELGFQATSASAPPVITPDSPQAAADLLGACSREGWRVRLAGGSTRARPAGDAQVVISAAALRGIDVHVPEDLTVGVHAGTTHAALEHALAAHRQVLPLDPAVADDATLGGTVAAAAAGPLRAGYGTPRDLVLGILAITADGRMLRLGGQVVKNVAGYDLVRLLIGSRGTLAFITQVHVRLRSAPAADVTVLAPAAGPEHAASLALALRDAVHPVALEVMAPRAGETWRVALRLQGGTAATDAAVQRITREHAGAAVLPDAAGFWAEQRLAEGAAGTLVRLQARGTDLPHLLGAGLQIVNSASDKNFGEWRLAAHGADGIVRLYHPGKAPASAARLEAVLPAVAADLATIDGTCICERGPETLRDAAPPPRPAAAVARLEAELRRRFDPAAILVGG